jgi:hypothetical protein
VPFANGRPSGPAEDVVTGFLIDGDKASDSQEERIGNVSFDSRRAAR